MPPLRRNPVIFRILAVLAVLAVSAPAQEVTSGSKPEFVTEEHRSLLAAVNFEAHAANPASLSAAALDSIAPLLALAKNRRYEVHGFSCEAAGTEQSSGMRSSAERVEVIVKYLTKNRVPSASIVTIIHGAARSTKSGSGSDCARVEIITVETRQREVIPEPKSPPKQEPGAIDMAEFRSKLEPESESGDGSGSGSGLGSESVSIAESASTTESAPTPKVEPTPADSQGRPILAIYMAGTEPPAAKGSHYILGSELARTISESDKYLAVDRTEDIQAQIAKEHVYQREGGVDDDQIKELGMQLGAQYLCIGNIKDVGKRSYYLDVRLVDVVTAQIQRTVTANSSLKDANEKTRVAREIAYELIETDKARAARKLKKKIFLFTGIGLDALGAGALVYGYFENGNVVKEIDRDDGPEADRAATRRNVGYIVGAALIASGVSVQVFF